MFKHVIRPIRVDYEGNVVVNDAIKLQEFLDSGYEIINATSAGSSRPYNGNSSYNTIIYVLRQTINQ